MNATETDIAALARHLFEMHGAKGIKEAAQKPASFELAGDDEQSRIWRRVEADIVEMRGPHES